jgi:hypothetical protein
MYLPLTGFYKEEEKDKLRMSINSINSGINNSYFIKPTAEAGNINNDVRKVEHNKPNEDANAYIGGIEENNKNFRRSEEEVGGMATQDFLSLRKTAHIGEINKNEDPYAVLDEVIARMKENMEELGKALETIKDMSDASNGTKLALKLLEETFEAIDEIAGGDKLTDLFKDRR